MTQHDNTKLLSSIQTQALNEIKQKVNQKFPIKDYILYGSTVRGEADDESDLDLLIVTSKALTRFKRHEITDIVFEVNLQFGTNFSTLVVDRESWETGMISVLPLRNEILREGVRHSPGDSGQ
jgi:predicted nucleotidyltransferase